MGGNNGQQETAGTVKEEVTGRNRQTSKNIERRIYEKKRLGTNFYAGLLLD